MFISGAKISDLFLTFYSIIIGTNREFFWNAKRWYFEIRCCV